MTYRRYVIAVPIVICNLIAFTGQLAFIRDHMHGWPVIGDIGLAAGLESIALTLSWFAHDALIHEDSALRLRLGSYIAAGIAAALNYSHYAIHMRPNFAALSTALMSFMSPILWGIYSRRNSRDALKSKGLIEPLSVKFGLVRWLWWPRQTFSAFRMAAWSGQREPGLAITAWEESRAAAEAETAASAQAEGMSLDTVTSKADAVRIALREAGENLSAPDVSAWLKERGHVVTPEYVRVIRSAERKRLRAAVRAVPMLPAAERREA